MAETTQREKLLAFGGVLTVLFLSSLNMTVVGTALPRIIAELIGSVTVDASENEVNAQA